MGIQHLTSINKQPQPTNQHEVPADRSLDGHRGFCRTSRTTSQTTTEPPTPTSWTHQEHCRARHSNPISLHTVGGSKGGWFSRHLGGPGPFTVFAPSNNAFAQIPSATLNGLLADTPALTAVLLRHVVPGAIFAKDVPPGETVLDTAGGEKITVTRDRNNYISIRSSAGESYGIAFDVAATNGVVHIVNKVF